MTTPTVRLTREQRIVDRLVTRLPRNVQDLDPLEARAQALPAMLRRHGPVQVLLFLAAKGERDQPGNGAPKYTDKSLAEWLVEGISAGLGTDELAPATADQGNEVNGIAGGESKEPSKLLVGAYAEWLAQQALAPYLLRWEVAIEVAGWLKMLIAARIEEAAVPASPPDTPADTHPERAGEGQE